MTLSKNCLLAEIDIEKEENKFLKQSKNQEMARGTRFLIVINIYGFHD